MDQNPFLVGSYVFSFEDDHNWRQKEKNVERDDFMSRDMFYLRVVDRFGADLMTPF